MPEPTKGQSVCPTCGHVEGELQSFQLGRWWKWRAFWRGFFGFFNPSLLPPGSRHIFDRSMSGQSRNGVSQRDGFKLVGEHREGCLACRDGKPFVITDMRRPHDHRLKRNGNRGGSTIWWRFVCNDLRCSAVLLVRWDRIMDFINGTED